ncbi:MAG TPA: universal stress protein [Candidatus Kryptonia bacterium]|nr:universal stress protein [Candidatus Kryptonia bacterium]
MTIKRILVPIDFSEPSLAGLDYAVELSRRLNAALVVILVLEVLYYAAENVGRLLEEQRRLAEVDLARLADRFARRGVELETVLETGLPAQAIVETARKRDVDLIVMATHGRTGFSHLLMGSVAEKVVRTAQCPVLTVPTHQPRRARVRHAATAPRS